MDPSFAVQLQSRSPASVLPLLHGLKKILRDTTYSYGAIYETVAGPFALGMRFSESTKVAMPVLSLLGETSAKKHDSSSSSNNKKPRSPTTPKRSAANLSQTIERNWASQGAVQADALETIHTFIGRNGLHSPAVATYIIHIDILADAAAHHALHWIGQSEFNRLPGWLSESLFRITPSQDIPSSSSPSSRQSTSRQSRYVCVEAYDFRTNPDELAALLQNFRDDPRRGPGVGPKCKMRVYKLFGSVGGGELFRR